MLIDSMKKMEMHAHCDHLDPLAVGRMYIAELVPLLENIQAQPAFSSSLTKRERADLVRFAADVCLVKAAGANAQWGKALRKTLINLTNIACVDHHHDIGTDDVCAKKPHHLDVAAQVVGTELRGTKKSSHFADRIYHKYRHARTHGRSNRNKQQDAIRQYRGASRRGDSVLQRGARQRDNDKYWGANTHGNKDMLLHEIKGTVSYSGGRIRKTYANKAIGTAAALACAKEEHPQSMFTMASQIEDLQQLIPGGTSLIDPASLLEETALYILALQMQVHSLHALANIAPASS